MLSRVSAMRPTLMQLLAMAAPIAALSFVTDVTAGDTEKDPYAMADETRITLSGEVESVDPDRVTLDYGDG